MPLSAAAKLKIREAHWMAKALRHDIKELKRTMEYIPNFLYPNVSDFNRLVSIVERINARVEKLDQKK